VYGAARAPSERIVASVNPLHPEARHHLSVAADDRLAVIETKSDRLRGLVADIDNVYFNIKSERHSYYQGPAVTGRRRVADVILRAERNGNNWRAAVADSGIDADAYLYRDRTRDAFLPWQIIDGTLKASFFQREYEKSLRAEENQRTRAQPGQVCREADLSRPEIHAAYCAVASAASCSLYATRMRSRSLFCDVLSTIGRSRAKLRRSPLTEYCRPGR
jgi:hypothetical protein